MNFYQLRIETISAGFNLGNGSVYTPIALFNFISIFF
jgi:hypothetical protein